MIQKGFFFFFVGVFSLLQNRKCKIAKIVSKIAIYATQTLAKYYFVIWMGIKFLLSICCLNERRNIKSIKGIKCALILCIFHLLLEFWKETKNPIINTTDEYIYVFRDEHFAIYLPLIACNRFFFILQFQHSLITFTHKYRTKSQAYGKNIFKQEKKKKIQQLINK